MSGLIETSQMNFLIADTFTGSLATVLNPPSRGGYGCLLSLIAGR